MIPALHLIPVFLSLLILLATTPLTAQEAAPESQPPAVAPPSPEGQRIYSETLQLINQNQLEKALAKLASIPESDATHPEVLNLKGALLVRKKDYAAAAATFGKILENNPNNALAHFNLGEVHYLQKDYVKAKSLFNRFLQYPGNSQNALARYKVFLCDLLGVDPSAAALTLSELEPTISHPFFYFAHAAQEFKNGQPEKAREYIQSALNIYPRGLNTAFADSMVELGWLKPEEVGQITEMDAATLQSLSNEFRPKQTTPDTSSSSSPGFENILPDFFHEPKTNSPVVQP